jgi:hypothetical protein
MSDRGGRGDIEEQVVRRKPTIGRPADEAVIEAN